MVMEQGARLCWSFAGLWPVSLDARAGFAASGMTDALEQLGSWLAVACFSVRPLRRHYRRSD